MDNRKVTKRHLLKITTEIPNIEFKNKDNHNDKVIKYVLHLWNIDTLREWDRGIDQQQYT